MLKIKTVGILALTAVVCVGLYVPLQRTLAMPESSTTDTTPKARIEFQSFDKTAALPKLRLLAHVENASDSPIKVLRWNSVLDPQAGLLGAITLRGKGAKDIEVPTIMVSRQLPPSADDYVRIDPHKKVSNAIDVVLDTTEVEDGATYEVLARGDFMEVYQDDQQGDPARVPYVCDAVKFTA
jgi:hypothetical protein